MGVKIVGIDPGYATVGCGAVEFSKGAFRALAYGAIETPASEEFPRRLLQIDDELRELLERIRPQAVAVEKLYFNTNTTTAIDVAQARGVIVACAAKQGIPIFEYTPLQVKLAVVGYGRAEKMQVMEMTRMILGLEKLPRPDDVADALAIAICHAHTAASGIGRATLQNGKEIQR
ncbi:MAG: crossover junction endodeoxyribonuclease RuvC [Oscillospiraceae bacterium]